jgi:hypothetical protein
MRALSAYLSLSSVLLACSSSSSNKANVIFYVDPPPDGDVGCIGVAGFDVAISSGGRTSPSGPLLNAGGPVLESSACRLSRPFSLPDLDLDAPASVAVTGYDGAGMARVEATGHIDNLHGNPPHLQLRTTTTPPLPVLVVHRGPLLGIAKLSEVTRLEITTMRQPLTLLNITPGDYFSVEPAAYGISANLSPTGADNGVALFALVTINNGSPLRTKLTAMWNASGHYYDAQ